MKSLHSKEPIYSGLQLESVFNTGITNEALTFCIKIYSMSEFYYKD